MWLSVIMPIYNSEKTIESAITSILDQRALEVEIIVIDGKSTDRTMEIVNRYRDKLAYVVSERDNGYADALNKGIRKAKGKYVMMLAADDTMLPNSLKNAKQSIKEDTDVWCGSIISKTELGYQLEESDKNIEELEKRCSLRHPATIFRRDIFERFGYYDTSFRCVADWDLFLRLKRGGAKFQIEPVAMVLFSKTGMSNMNGKLLYEEDCCIAEKYQLGFIPQLEVYMKMTTLPKWYSFQRKLSNWHILPYIYKIVLKENRFLTQKEYNSLISQ